MPAQIAGDLRQTQDALGDDERQHAAAHQLGRGRFQESELQPFVLAVSIVIIRRI